MPLSPARLRVPAASAPAAREDLKRSSNGTVCNMWACIHTHKRTANRQLVFREPATALSGQVCLLTWDWISCYNACANHRQSLLVPKAIRMLRMLFTQPTFLLSSLEGVTSLGLMASSCLGGIMPRTLPNYTLAYAHADPGWIQKVEPS